MHRIWRGWETGGNTVGTIRTNVKGKEKLTMRDCQNKANRKRTPRQELNKPEDKAEDPITKLRPEAQSNPPPQKKQQQLKNQNQEHIH